MTRKKVRLFAPLGETVPGTDQLAVITAVDAVAEQRSQFIGNAAFVFNSEIGDAASGIHHIGLDNGRSRTDIETGPATAAMVANGLIRRQRQIGIEFAEKEPGAGGAVKNIAVLADPAKPGLCRKRFFQHRGAVDKYPITELADLLSDTPCQLLQALAH